MSGQHGSEDIAEASVGILKQALQVRTDYISVKMSRRTLSDGPDCVLCPHLAYSLRARLLYWLPEGVLNACGATSWLVH